MCVCVSGAGGTPTPAQVLFGGGCGLGEGVDEEERGSGGRPRPAKKFGPFFLANFGQVCVRIVGVHTHTPYATYTHAYSRRICV